MPRLIINEPQVEPLPEPGHGFDLYVGNSFDEIQIGGAGRIHGNREWRNEVTVLGAPGTITFDASFNAGNDVIALSGTMQEWTIRVSGSNAVFERPGRDVWIPMGQLTWVEFQNGFGALQFDQAKGAFTFGGQVLGADAVVPVSSGTGDPVFDPAFGDAPTYLYTNGSPVTVFGIGDANSFDMARVIHVVGTDGPDHVVTGTTRGLTFFDASFNRGGDTIELPSNLPVSLSGSLVHFGLGLNGVLIPFGPNGLELEFANGDATLIYDTASGHVLIGDQVITVDPAPLHIFG